jgi:hypothetical protein
MHYIQGEARNQDSLFPVLQFQACEDAGITAYVPPNRAINNQGDGQQFDRSVFIYAPETDCYRCPNGQTLELKNLNKGRRVYAASADQCVICPLKAQCTKAKRRYLTRHAHEDAFARMEH